MSDFLTFGVVAFTAVFFVVDPPAAIPIFLAMTANESPSEKRRTSLRDCFKPAKITNAPSTKVRGVAIIIAQLTVNRQNLRPNFQERRGSAAKCFLQLRVTSIARSIAPPMNRRFASVHTGQRTYHFTVPSKKLPLDSSTCSHPPLQLPPPD